MPRLYMLLLAVILGGCIFISDEPPITPTPTPTPVPALRVLGATYKTNYQDPNTGSSYICDNRATTLTYRFSYQGELESWTSYLEGQTLGQIKGERTFTPGSQGVISLEERGFEVQYVMSPYFAPYGNSVKKATITPQAIVVVPVPQPIIIGQTKLYLTLMGENGEAKPYSSKNIPVVSNCP